MSRSRYSFVLLRLFTYARQFVGDLTPAEISRHAGVRKQVVENVLAGRRIKTGEFEKMAAYHGLRPEDFDRAEPDYAALRGEAAA